MFSLLFVLYWLLGLDLIGGELRLFFANYKVTNEGALVWVVHVSLIYFAWRFYLDSKGKLAYAYRNAFGLSGSALKSTRLLGRLKRHAEQNYIESKKEGFERKRSEEAAKRRVADFDNQSFDITFSKFGYSGKKVVLHYQVRYKGDAVQSNDFCNGQVEYSWKDWPFLRVWCFIKFFVSKEEAADYLVPWLLFFLAMLCSVMANVGITVHDIIGDKA
ncbi:hypothetical protein LG302_00790 [Halomonas organivorans]